MKISKIIEGALKQLGVLAAGENAQAGELADAVDCLHQLLAQWATDQFYVYKSNLLVLKLDGSGIYRIMSKQHSENFCCDYEISDCISCNSGEFTSEECTCGLHQPRPKVHLKENIESIATVAWLDGKQIDLVRDKNNMQPSYTAATYQQDGCDWVFKVQDRSAKELKIKAFTFPEIFDCNDELMVPKHYERALRLSLALEIAPMFGTSASPELIKNLDNAMRFLNKSNVTPIYSGNTNHEIGIGVGANHHGWSC